jgi:hypothetical protein
MTLHTDALAADPVAMRADEVDVMLAKVRKEVQKLTDADADVAEVRGAAEQLTADAKSATERVRAATEAYLQARQGEADRVLEDAEAALEAARTEARTTREEAVRARVAADAYADVRRAQAERDAEELIEAATAEAARLVAEAQATVGAMIAAAVIDDRTASRVRLSENGAGPDVAVPDATAANGEPGPAEPEPNQVQLVVLPAGESAQPTKPKRGRFTG